MASRDEVRRAQSEYIYQVTSKLGVPPFEIFSNFTTFRLPNELTSIVFYAFRNQLRREWVESDHPVKMMELALSLVESVKYAKVETQPNFVRFRFETHAELPVEDAAPLKAG